MKKTLKTFSLLAFIPTFLVGCSILPKEKTPSQPKPQIQEEQKATEEIETKKELSVDRVKTSIIGQWRSVDDEESELVFYNDESFFDLYNGDEVGDGNWTIRKDDQLGLLLEKTIDEDVSTYSILNINEDQLTMSYLARGNTLKFMRIGEEQAFNESGRAKAIEEVGLANPASVNCIEKGGTLEIKENEDGGQYGLCIFADGHSCEEWALFREECE